MNKRASHRVASEFALEALTYSAGTLADAYRCVQAGSGDPVEAVHDLRVAIRRVRADLRIFAKVFDGAWLDATQRQLRDLGRVVGEARDLDVIGSRLEQLAETLPEADRPGAARLLSGLQLDRGVAFERTCDALDSGGRASIVGDLVAISVRSPLAHAAGEVAIGDLVAATRHQWQRLRKSARAAKAAPTAENLHKVRVRAKTLRYSLDTLEPVLHRSARAHAKVLVELQDHLGKMQDAVVIERWLRSARAADPSIEFVVGEFIGLERARKESARSTWRDEWRRVSRKRLRRWAR